MVIGSMTLEDAAKEAAGNWQRFHCFAWFRRQELSDAENWAIIYTSNRDSGLLDQSNSAVIAEEMETFMNGDDPDVVPECHSHWVVGHVDGFSIRVFRNNQITAAFRKYFKLIEQLDTYPILDEDDYSNREYEATVENLSDAAWRLKNDYVLPDSWQEEVYSWFSDNQWNAIENTDDQGGYPSEDELREAFEGLGYETIDT